MFDRYERPVKIICLGLAALLVWQLGSLILTRDPLANLKIPALPALPGATNEAAKADHKETNAATAAKTGTNGTNVAIATNGIVGTNLVAGTNMVVSTNVAIATNVAKGTNIASNTNALPATNVLAKSTNAPTADKTVQTDAGSRKPAPPGGMPGLPPGMTPEMMANLPPEVAAQMMGGGMPGGRRGGGAKKMELPPEVKARVDSIIASEIFGPIIRPMPMALIGIADQEAFIQATNGQTDAVKVGGEMGGIKLLRIGINRVLVEHDGEKQELTLFDGIGGASLMPKSTNEPSTNAASTNAPMKKASKRKAAAGHDATNQTLSSKQKETP
jgi:hypothetical protein